MRIGSVILLIWLAVGITASAQRDYFEGGPRDCAGLGTIAVTVIAGPLNYMGVNPKVENCDIPDIPQPSP
ncbi:hypothetical protein [Nocardia callitridis]|uniref:Uncharacterized protein n=1 Tax=Nocardia callitridis TaxID=648753 RepID=A0ABP9JV41_9NOCA